MCQFYCHDLGNRYLLQVEPDKQLGPIRQTLEKKDRKVSIPDKLRLQLNLNEMAGEKRVIFFFYLFHDFF